MAFVAMLLAVAAAIPAAGADRANAACAECAAWNQPHKPFQIYGNTWYVGTAGLSSVLVTSEYGHVLVDAGLPESAPLIAASIEALGFKLADVKAIVSSDPHVEHAGGIAELQRLTGAPAYAMRAAAETLRTGRLMKDDPAYGVRAPDIPPVPRVWVVQDDQLLGVGAVRLRVLATPGSSPGGASWTWDACEGSKCLAFVYAGNLAPVAAPKYRFRDHPDVLAGFERSFARLAAARCDILITPHPDPAVLQRLQQAGGLDDSIKDEGACRRYVEGGRAALQQRLAVER